VRKRDTFSLVKGNLSVFEQILNSSEKKRRWLNAEKAKPGDRKEDLLSECYLERTNNDNSDVKVNDAS